MARLEPIEKVGEGEAEAALLRIESLVGYRPNALATMARIPLVLERILALVDAVLRGEGHLSPGLKWLLAYAVSASAGCAYSASHAAHGAEHLGESLDRVRAAVTEPDSPMFSLAEQSALKLAHAIGRQQVNDTHTTAVRDIMGEQGLAEAVAVCALFGWFNRWNSTLATDLEVEPALFAINELSSVGWKPGPHQVPAGILSKNETK
ncbi:carboxymuconolactone decarboxylase family protein [Microvirga sp. 2YAF29]|uniref:carboxymuconolactone decarboxylase family protein n=1 Tax=Microvirga sp. 2YAF29 TaxID=3233031 RepID=UPI003F9AA26E